MKCRFFGRASLGLLLAPALLLPAGGLSAQEDEAMASYRIAAFGKGEFKENRFANSRGGETFKVNLSHVSNPITAELREGQYLDFFRENTADEDPPAFSLEISPQNRTDLLVLLIVDGEKLKPQLLDLQKLKIERGGQLVYNLAGYPVAFRCGDNAKEVVIKPGKRELVPPPTKEKVVQTIFYPGPDGKPKKAKSSLYFNDKGTRQVVFCLPGRRPGDRPQIKPIAIYDQKKPERPRGG